MRQEGKHTMILAGGNPINLSTDDPQELRLFIAVKFPFISEDDAKSFIAQVLEGRSDVSSVGGFGYGPAELRQLEQELESINAKGRATLITKKTYRSPITVGDVPG